MRNPLGIVGGVGLGLCLLAFFLLLDKTYKKREGVSYARLGVMLSLALILGFVESMLPDILVPGVKLGLSNVAVLVVIYVYGPKEGLLLAVLKALIVSFFAGTFMSMGGFMSLVGSSFSAIMMIFLHIAARRFSPVAVSLVGALSHICGQMLVAHVYLGPAVWAYAPLALALSMATGIFTGIIAALLLRHKAFIAYMRRE